MKHVSQSWSMDVQCSWQYFTTDHRCRAISDSSIVLLKSVHRYLYCLSVPPGSQLEISLSGPWKDNDFHLHLSLSMRHRSWMLSNLPLSVIFYLKITKLFCSSAWLSHYETFIIYHLSDQHHHRVKYKETFRNGLRLTMSIVCIMGRAPHLDFVLGLYIDINFAPPLKITNDCIGSHLLRPFALPKHPTWNSVSIWPRSVIN